MTKTHFHEEQKFNQWWIWLLIAVCSGIWIWSFVQQILMGKPFGQNPMSDLGVILTGFFPVIIILLFQFLKLETVIDDQGIKCRFKPFQRKFKTFLPHDIVRWEVKKYHPIREYGGWGIRSGFFRNSSAYNVTGNVGLYMELKSKKSFLIGTQRPDAIKHAMEKLMKV